MPGNTVIKLALKVYLKLSVIFFFLSVFVICNFELILKNVKILFPFIFVVFSISGQNSCNIYFLSQINIDGQGG